MSKITNAIMMLEYLNTGKKYSVKELSEKLNVSERMIKYYKEQLEYAGIYIETFMGPNGGYFLNNIKNSYRQFNNYDIELLKNVERVLEKHDFEFLDKYINLRKKIEDAFIIEQEIASFTEEINETDEKSEILKLVKNAVDSKEKIDIIYKDVSGELNSRIIHPVHIYNFKDTTFITAYCELRRDIRHFELERIIKINK